MAEKPNHLLCFGFGFSARALAQALPHDRWNITGTSRSAEGCEKIEQLGFAAVQFNDDTPLDLSHLDGVTHVVVSVPPGKTGDPVLKLHGRDLAARSAKIKWLAYLSTTGVYGDRRGGWVDETSPLQPSTARGHARLAAETGWLELWRDTGLAVHLFRLAGIYGPGRNQLQSLKSGKARRIVKPGQVFSRIHVADIAGILRASMDKPSPGSAYNVCDDEAAPPQDVVAYAAGLLGVEPPPEVAFEDADLSDMAKSFYAESKRVSNDKVKTELGYSFTYPTYHQGLKALL
ncbi:MAG: SDR family oxidoreductase [Pseudomonadota bacterium]